MISLLEFIRENLELNHNELFKNIEDLIRAQNVEEYNSLFNDIYNTIQQMDQTVTFDKNLISNLDPKGFYCCAIRYTDIKYDDPKYHGDTIGAVSIGPGMGKTVEICWNNNAGSQLDKANGAFAHVVCHTGGYKKDVFPDESRQNSIKYLGNEKSIKTFITNLVKNAHIK